MKKSAIVVVINSLLIYDYVGGREGVNPDPDEVKTSSIYMCTGNVFTGGITVYVQMQYQSRTYLGLCDKQRSCMTKEQVFIGHKFGKSLI